MVSRPIECEDTDVILRLHLLTQAGTGMRQQKVIIEEMPVVRGGPPLRELQERREPSVRR